MLDRAIWAEDPILMSDPTEMMSELMGCGFATVAMFLSFVAGSGDRTRLSREGSVAPSGT